MTKNNITKATSHAIQSVSSDTSSILDMHGPLHFRFTNDYLLRATLQSSSLALKGLICALMGLPMEDIQEYQDEQEFYSEYKMMNGTAGKVYNDKFILRVLELTQIKNVSEEMRHTDLYRWARLFKASNWEDVSALAEENVVFKETASTIKKTDC